MRKKIFILLICILVFPINIKAIDIEKNWNSYTKILPNAVVGQEYNYQLETTETDITEYKESLTREKLDINYIYVTDEYAILPDGLTISSDGIISGTPTKAGTYTFYVTCKRGTSGTVLSGEIFYGIRYLATSFTISVLEEEKDLSKELTINDEEIIGIFDKSFNKIINNGDLSIIRGNSTYNGEGYTISNNEDAYLYDVSFLNGKNVIYNTDKMILDNVSFHFNESEDYIINNEKNLFLNNVSFSNNYGSKYSIYNDKGNIILTGELNTTLLNYDYDKDTIYIGNSGEFYFDVKNGNPKLSDYSKLRGNYRLNLNVIINSTWDSDKEIVLIENYKLVYKFKNNLLTNSLVTKDEPYIKFVTTSSYMNFYVIDAIYPGESFTYNGYSYSLVENKTNSQLILKITKVGESTEETDFDFITPKMATASGNTNNQNDNTTDTSYTGDVVKTELNITNVIILSCSILVVGIIIVVIILKKRKKNK